MSTCRYCGASAGLFKSVHRECQDLHASGILEIGRLATSAINSLIPVGKEIQDVAMAHYVSSSEVRDIVVDSWEAALDAALDDHLVSEEEETRLANAIDQLPITKQDLQDEGPFIRFVEALTLRDLDEGKVPSRVTVDGGLPFNFQKSESLVWVFQDVDYYEDRTRSTFVGGSRGVSVRIAKGVYYRVGSFKGERIPVTETVHVGTGLLAATTKHLYFSGGAKSFRIPYSKIVSINAYEDGFGIHRDAITAKPQTFVTGDGWFSTNLVNKLASMA